MAAIAFGFDVAANHWCVQNGPLSREEVQVSNRLITDAEVQNEAIKKL